MLPSQILLNNLLYDVGQLAIPTDNVDAEVLARPAAWDIAFVRRFMSVFGPISSIFDFLTFFVMLVDPARQPRRVPHRLVRRVARHPDPRRVPDPNPSSAVLPQPTQHPDDHHADHLRRRSAPSCRSRPLADVLGFTALPLSFFLILLGMIVGLPRPRRDRQEPLLRHPGPPPPSTTHRPGTPTPPHQTTCRPLHPPHTAPCGTDLGSALRRRRRRATCPGR